MMIELLPQHQWAVQMREPLQKYKDYLSVVGDDVSGIGWGRKPGYRLAACRHFMPLSSYLRCLPGVKFDAGHEQRRAKTRGN